MSKAIKKKVVKPPYGEKRKVRVKAKYLAMLAPFVSRESVRYYLGGIFIQKHPVKGVLLIATDGHRMGVVHDETGVTNGAWICPVPAELVKAIVKGQKSVVPEIGDAHFVGEQALVTGRAFADSPKSHQADAVKIYAASMQSMKARPLDGTYPDWKRLFDMKPIEDGKMHPASFNPEYIAAFKSVANAAGVPGSAITIASPSPECAPALVAVPNVPEFIGLLMPVRAGKGNDFINESIAKIMAENPKAPVKKKAPAKRRAAKKK